MNEPIPQVDRTAFSVVELCDQDADDRAFWLAKTPEERLAGVEMMRRIVYGYDPATTRLQRVFEVVDLV